MAFSIGRLGTDITIRNPSSVTRSGNTVTVTGHVEPNSAEKRSALMQQLQGLMNNPDEPTVPFVYSQDTSKQGYYTPVSVNTTENPTTPGTFRFSYQVQLELLPGGLSLPELELITVGAARANKPAGLTQVYAVGIPGSARSWSMPSGSPNSSAWMNAYNTTPDYVHIFTGNDLVTYAPTFTIAPEDYYDASCYLKMGTSEFYTVGRQVDDTPTLWEMGNGVVTIGPAADDTYLFNMQFRKLAGGANSVTNYDIELGYVTAGPTWNTFDPATANAELAMITCLRNSPEECRIRLTWGTPSSGFGLGNTVYRFQVDLTVRRGMRGVGVYFNSNGYTATTWGMGPRPTAAHTAIDANNRGLLQDTADADGTKRVTIGEKAVTLSTGTGRIWGGSVQSFGAWFGGQALTGEADAAQDWYFAAMSTKQRVVPK